MADATFGRRAARPRFQFSLFWLLVVVTIVAVVLGLGASVGPVFGVVWLATLFFVRCAFVTPLLVLAICGHGRIRAFAIGGLVPWGVSISWDMSLSVLVLTICYSVACGFLATATWRRVLGTHDG